MFGTPSGAGGNRHPAADFTPSTPPPPKSGACFIPPAAMRPEDCASAPEPAWMACPPELARDWPTLAHAHAAAVEALCILKNMAVHGSPDTRAAACAAAQNRLDDASDFVVGARKRFEKEASR